MIKSTGFKDNKGIPICENDLVKIYHFKSRSRKHYMYKRVMKVLDKFYLVPNEEIGTLRIDCWHKNLMYRGMPFEDMEIIDGDSFNHPFDGVRIYWTDRKLKRNIFLFEGAN
jgi:hypothetical protein